MQLEDIKPGMRLSVTHHGTGESSLRGESVVEAVLPDKIWTTSENGTRSFIPLVGCGMARIEWTDTGLVAYVGDVKVVSYAVLPEARDA